MPRSVPAAHSMDSCWFAVDADGHVAWFDTGEGGALPDGFPAGGDRGDLEIADVVAEALRFRAERHEPLAALLREHAVPARELVERLDVHRQLALLSRWLGVYAFECGAALAVPYHRRGLVPAPLDVRALPAPLGPRLARAVLPVRWAEAELVAPGEHVAVQTWGDDWVDTEGRVRSTGDGKEVQAPDDYEAEDFDQARGSVDDGGPVPSDEEMLAQLRWWWAPRRGGVANGETPLVYVRPPRAPRPAEDLPKRGGFFAWLARWFG